MRKDCEQTPLDSYTCADPGLPISTRTTTLHSVKISIGRDFEAVTIEMQAPEGFP